MDLYDGLVRETDDDAGAQDGEGVLADVQSFRHGREDPAAPALNVPMTAQPRLAPEQPEEPEHLRDFWMGLPVEHKQQLFDHYHANNNSPTQASQEPAPQAPVDAPSTAEQERTLHGLLIREVR